MNKVLIFIALISLIFACLIGETGWAKSKAPDKADLVPPDSGFIQILNLNDGSVYFGAIVELKDNNLVFRTDIGGLNIPFYKIESLETVPKDKIIRGKYWFPNPNATRLFFAPTAKMLKKGEGYFADYYIFFPSISYGITDNIILGGGCSLIPGLPLHRQILYFTPKIGINANLIFDLAGGALVIKIPDFDDGESNPTVGIIYGVGTLGEAEQSLTLGLGYGFVGEQLADNPMMMIGGETRIARHLALVSENWILPGVDNPLISYGVRFFSQKISVDLAFINTLGEDAIFPGFPYVDFIVQF